MLTAEWGYDRYPGVCHIIPNAGVTVMAIALRRGRPAADRRDRHDGGLGHRLQRRQCGGHRRHVPGLAAGLGQVSQADQRFVVASGVLGTVNIVDIPSFARELTVLAQRLNGERRSRCGPRISSVAACASTSTRRARRTGSAPKAFNQIVVQGIDGASRTELARRARNPARPAGARAGRPGVLEAVLPAVAISTTSAIARCSRRWPTTGRWSSSSSGSTRGTATAICASCPMCGAA